MTDDRDVRDLLPLPRATFHILVALQEGPLHGYGVKQRVETTSEGAVRMAPATLYETLHRMKARGLVEETDSELPPADDHPQRSYYRLTSFGRAVMTAEVHRLGNLVDRARQVMREAGRA
jgi:DNA-binding PadR family transcriptional regulator